MLNMTTNVLLAVAVIFMIGVTGQFEEFDETVYTEEQTTLEHEECGTKTIRCICGIGNTRTIKSIEMKMHRVNSFSSSHSSEYSENFYKSDEIECATSSDPYQECAKYSCFLAASNATEDEESRPFKKKRNIVQMFYPQEFIVPRAGSPEGHRYKRQRGPCSVPPLKNAEIKCWKWPNWQNCDINCIYGYAIEGSKESVKSININCRNSEDTWKPSGFVDCRPYVNCKASLVKPGELKCKEPINGPAYCEISCLDYDQYEATHLQRYECIDDTFRRSLPHCAIVKEIGLIRKPK